MAQEIKMSASGLKAMQDELEYLKTVRRKELAEEIKEARSHGDLSENSEYDEAKNTQGLVENRITELEQMVKNAVIIDESELTFAFLVRRSIRALARAVAAGRSAELAVTMPLSPRSFVRASTRYWTQMGAANGCTPEQMASMDIEPQP